MRFGRASKQKPIEFDNKDFETKSVLEQVLAILIDGGNISDTPIPLLGGLVSFLRKYDFKSTFDLVRFQLRAVLFLETQHNNVYWVLFMQSAHFDDHELCGKIIASSGNRFWQVGPQRDSIDEWSDGVDAGSTFDPSAMPKSWHDLLPKDSFWALLRASRMASFHKRPLELNEMGSEYVRLMKIRGKCTCTSTSTHTLTTPLITSRRREQ